MTKEERKLQRYRMYDGKRIKRPSRVGMVIVSILLVINLAAAFIISGFRSYFGVVDNIVFTKAPSGSDVDDITEQAKAITMQEAEEGIVLLSNKEETLPLDNGTAINVSVSLPENTSLVPNVLNFTRDLAINQMESSGFIVNYEEATLLTYIPALYPPGLGPGRYHLPLRM